MESELSYEASSLYWDAAYELSRSEEGNKYLQDRLIKQDVTNYFCLITIIFEIELSNSLTKEELVKILIPYLSYVPSGLCLNSEDESVIAYTIDALANLEAFNLPEVEALKDEDSPYIQSSLLAYRVCSLEKEEQISVLLSALDSPIALVREQAIDLIYELGFASFIPLSTQERLLNDTDEGVRDSMWVCANL
jgi:hypothetical protein